MSGWAMDGWARDDWARDGRRRGAPRGTDRIAGLNFTVAGHGPAVLFVHGFCSSADTWNETLPQLSTRRYGDDAPRLYEAANGTMAARTPAPMSASAPGWRRCSTTAAPWRASWPAAPTAGITRSVPA